MPIDKINQINGKMNFTCHLNKILTTEKHAQIKKKINKKTKQNKNDRNNLTNILF